MFHNGFTVSWSGLQWIQSIQVGGNTPWTRCQAIACSFTTRGNLG